MLWGQEICWTLKAHSGHEQNVSSWTLLSWCKSSPDFWKSADFQPRLLNKGKSSLCRAQSWDKLTSAGFGEWAGMLHKHRFQCLCLIPSFNWTLGMWHLKLSFTLALSRRECKTSDIYYIWVLWDKLSIPSPGRGSDTHKYTHMTLYIFIYINIYFLKDVP